MTYLPLFEFETQVMQIWKTAIYCYQQFRQSYVRVTVDWIILKLTNTPMMVVVIPFDSTSKIHIPVSWIQWAPPTVILVTIKGANTHFFEEVRKTGGGVGWNCFIRLLVCSAVSCTMKFSSFLICMSWKRLEGEIFNFSLKNNHLK